MPQPLRDPRLAEEVARFETELRGLALSLVAQVFAEELARREAATPAPAARKRGRPPKPRPAAPAPAPVATAEPAAAVPAPRPGKRRVWTRESVLEELSTWLLSGTSVEAAFVARHGQPGLVAGAKRLFGRFDAALNAANLVLSQRFPAGPPTTESR